MRRSIHHFCEILSDKFYVTLGNSAQTYKITRQPTVRNLDRVTGEVGAIWEKKIGPSRFNGVHSLNHATISSIISTTFYVTFEYPAYTYSSARQQPARYLDPLTGNISPDSIQKHPSLALLGPFIKPCADLSVYAKKFFVRLVVTLK